MAQRLRTLTATSEVLSSVGVCQKTLTHKDQKRIFIYPTRWGPPSQHAGQRRDPEQRKNTLFIPL